MAKINPLDTLMDKLEKQFPEGDTNKHKMTVMMFRESRTLIAAAAKKRGLTLTSYMRLAILAFVAKDTGTDFKSLTREYREFDDSIRTRGMKSATGEDSGPWQIQSLKE